MESFHRTLFLVLGSLFSLSFILCGVFLLFVLDGWQKLGSVPQVVLGGVFMRYFIQKYGKANREKA